jgi:hypothetical protein
MKKVLSIFAILLALFVLMPDAFAANRAELEQKLMVEDTYEAPAGRLFDEEAYFQGQTPFSGYTNVIVINKAARGLTAQTLRLYTNRQRMLVTKVSTGKEDLEYISKVKGFFRRLGNGKGTTQSHWRHTTRGFYSVKRVEDYDYHSGENKFHMPYAMFFNDDHGLAVHQVPPDLKGGEAAGEKALGHRASSGCVRVHKDIIVSIHDAVVAADRGEIPVLDSRTGQPKLDAQGNVVYEKGYRTLVIVEEY